MTLTCPICGKDDQVQKVSSIYDSGTATGTYNGPATTISYSDGKIITSGTYVTGSTMSSSRLAQKLAPPIKPSVPTNSCSYSAGIGMIVVFGLFSLIPIIGGYIEGASLIDMSIVAMPLSFVIIGIFLAIGASKKKKEKEKQYPQLLAEWENKTILWKNLFYCHRDETIYDARNGDQYNFKDSE